MFLEYSRSGDGRESFSIDGDMIPLSSLVAVRVWPASTVWADGAGTHTLDPAIEVEFASGLRVSFGREAEFGWTPWGASSTRGEEEARDALMARLRF